ncbi:MAG: LysM peptidoglycan-binding domain-containing protein [Spirochaetota bacterium]
MAEKRALLTIIGILLLATVSWSDEQVHTLARGETLYTLARRYSVPVDALLQYNEITDPTRLSVGTRIRIPGTYVVSEGEYIFSIARDLGVGWLELLDANGLDRDDVVRPGDVLLVPAGAAPRSDGDVVRADQPETAPPDSATGETPPANPGGGATQSADDWPHPGRRASWDGKFPGVVMQGSIGDEFRSVTNGVVEYIGPFSSFGKLILVRSANGYLYGYAGADGVLVSSGERVARGTVIGTVGYSPAFDSAMVLFTVWRNNRYVDPETAPRG